MHATTELHPTVERRRAARAPGRPPRRRRLYRAPLPDPARQCPGQAGPRYRRRSALRRPNRAHGDPCLQRYRRGGPDAWVACPHTTPHAAFDAATLAQLPTLLHRTPRSCGKATDVWTLRLLAEVAFDQGLTARRVSDEAIRGALTRLGISWKRAKQWITSPDPKYEQKREAVTD